MKADAPDPRPASSDSEPAAASDTPYDRRILEALRRIARGIDLHSRHLTADHGITTPQLVALRTLRRGGALSVSDLSRRMHLSPSTVVGIVDRLERGAFVARRRSETDRRRVYVELTEAGRDLCESAPSPLHDRLRSGLRELSDLERLTIAASLERLVELMEVEGLDAAPVVAADPLPPTD